MDRRRGTDRGWIVRERTGRHGMKRMLVAAMAPRLIRLAGRSRLAEARRLEAERNEEPLAHEVLPRFPGHALHHRPDDRIACIGIFPMRTGCAIGPVGK